MESQKELDNISGIGDITSMWHVTEEILVAQREEWGVPVQPVESVAIDAVTDLDGQTIGAGVASEQDLPPSSYSVVCALVDAIRAGSPIPPVILRADGSLADGHHRILAARVIGLSSVPAVRE